VGGCAHGLWEAGPGSLLHPAAAAVRVAGHAAAGEEALAEGELRLRQPQPRRAGEVPHRPPRVRRHAAAAAAAAAVDSVEVDSAASAAAAVI
jgi:hypothetical protein